MGGRAPPADMEEIARAERGLIPSRDADDGGERPVLGATLGYNDVAFAAVHSAMTTPIMPRSSW